MYSCTSGSVLKDSVKKLLVPRIPRVLALSHDFLLWDLLKTSLCQATLSAIQRCERTGQKYVHWSMITDHSLFTLSSSFNSCVQCAERNALDKVHRKSAYLVFSFAFTRRGRLRRAEPCCECAAKIRESHAHAVIYSTRTNIVCRSTSDVYSMACPRRKILNKSRHI